MVIMAHFAQLDADNIVQQVIVLSNDVCGEPTLDFPDTEAAGCAFIANTLKLGDVWKQTSYNGNFRKQYAGIGYTYDAVRDAFIAPQPFPSWELNEDTCRWEAPVPYPTDDKPYRWDEDTQAWVEISAG
ncbi:MAG: hypothetical protein EB101_11185 [Chitinophagia bacterium]|nr:hypothetical protein [Chitinophagia bacterium]